MKLMKLLKQVGFLNHVKPLYLCFQMEVLERKGFLNIFKKVKKMYHVVLSKKISQKDLNKIKKGVKLEEGTVLADSVSFIKNTPKNEVGIELHLGWNRVVRRLFEKLGYSVVKLDRVMFSFLTKKNLQRKKWRFLTKEEITLLKRI